MLPPPGTWHSEPRYNGSFLVAQQYYYLHFFILSLLRFLLCAWVSEIHTFYISVCCTHCWMLLLLDMYINHPLILNRWSRFFVFRFGSSQSLNVDCGRWNVTDWWCEVAIFLPGPVDPPPLPTHHSARCLVRPRPGGYCVITEPIYGNKNMERISGAAEHNQPGSYIKCWL